MDVAREACDGSESEKHMFMGRRCATNQNFSALLPRPGMGCRRGQVRAHTTFDVCELDRRAAAADHASMIQGPFDLPPA